jgi:uncharacterized BrkB/YihY/UPF0761 family membrane protein
MMLSTMGRKYQIDYMFGLRYVFSSTYRAKIHHTWGQSTGMRLLYMIGSLVSMAVVISALLFLALALEGLLR